ncbi:MAG TPA: rhodanese-like domain-containing protein [Phycisphaerales bacterium]|nr:rhodanese-like domain-containing protein [Phycisphaerales bacterium]
MADASNSARVLALIGLATIAGGVHSLVVPVHLERESGGFTIPGENEAGQSEDASRPAPSGSAEDSANDPSAADAPSAGASDETNAAQAAGAAEPAGKISLDLASRLHEKFLAGEPILFLDARNPEDFNAGHIEGALNMPHARLSGGDGLDEMALYASPGDGTLLVVYCTGGECEASEDAAILLEAAGYDNIAIMADGYDAWHDAGLPVEEPAPGAGESP